MLVKLKWRDGTFEHEEVVGLLAEDDNIYLKWDGTPMPLKLDDLVKDSGFVMFEDEEGLFGLKPEQVISIEPILP